MRVEGVKHRLKGRYRCSRLRHFGLPDPTPEISNHQDNVTRNTTAASLTESIRPRFERTKWILLPPSIQAAPARRQMMRSSANVIKITRPMNGIRRGRVQRGCVIEITAPIDSFLYTSRPAEGNGLLAKQEIAMEKNFETIELSLDNLASVTGGKDGGTTTTTITSSQGTCTTRTSTNRDGGTEVKVTCSGPQVIK